MEFSQRKFLTATRFEFAPERLVYQLKTLAGSKQLSVDYADIGADLKFVEERHSAYLYVGLILFGVGSLLGAFIYSTENKISGFSWAIIGIVFLVAYFVQRRKIIIIQTPREALIVLGGRNQAEILSQIDKGRKARFLQILERPDLLHDEAKRNGLIAALREQRIFSEEEASALILGKPLPDANETPGTKLH
jgi:hypothetical protein